MPKNLTGGNRHKKGKNKRPLDIEENVTYAEDNQIYAIVKKRLGGSRLLIECSDSKERNAIIPGKFYKKMWMNPGDIVLCELPTNDENLCYIKCKYTNKQITQLRSLGKINFSKPENIENNEPDHELNNNDSDQSDEGQPEHIGNLPDDSDSDSDDYDIDNL